MGTLTGANLISQLRVTLLDPTPGTTWTDAMLLGYINSAERAACALDNTLVSVRGAVAMAAGSIQTLPAGATTLFRIESNAVSGRACRMVDSSLVDARKPYARAATQEVDVQDYMIDPRDATKFRVLPPNDGTGSVIAFYGMTPTALGSTSATINLDDIYEDAIKWFVLGECYAANTKRQDLAKAANARQMFAQMIGAPSQASSSALPKTGVTQPGMN